MLRLAHQGLNAALVLSFQVIPLSFNKAKLRKEAEMLKHPREGTNTWDGIGAMIKEFKKNGRKNVPMICVVITDGVSKNITRTLEMAEVAKQEGKLILDIC